MAPESGMCSSVQGPVSGDISSFHLSGMGVTTPKGKRPDRQKHEAVRAGEQPWHPGRLNLDLTGSTADPRGKRHSSPTGSVKARPHWEQHPLGPRVQCLPVSLTLGTIQMELLSALLRAWLCSKPFTRTEEPKSVLSLHICSKENS